MLSQLDKEQIRQMHEIGVPHPDIGKQFGVSRERVRHIAINLGLPSRTTQLDQAWEQILSDAVKRRLNYRQVASEQQCQESHVRSRATIHGVKLGFRSSDELAALKRGAGYVLMGDSYYTAASRSGVTISKLKTYCAKVGVKSKHESKNPKYSEASR